MRDKLQGLRRLSLSDSCIMIYNKYGFSLFPSITEEKIYTTKNTDDEKYFCCNSTVKYILYIS